MDVYELKSEYQKHHPDGHYFDKDTLKFFGETLSTMRVMKGTVKVTDCLGKEHEAYILSKLQRGEFIGKKRSYDFFDINTFDHII